jgi:hypothetical protein
MSGSMEAQMAKKLYFAFSDLYCPAHKEPCTAAPRPGRQGQDTDEWCERRFSGFLELAALIATMTLLFWVSGLFLGLALCSVIVAFACLYVL